MPFGFLPECAFGFAGIPSVLLQWVWTAITGQRGSRLIIHHYGSNR
jgi:hypothetical protein